MKSPIPIRLSAIILLILFIFIHLSSAQTQPATKASNTATSSAAPPVPAQAIGLVVWVKGTVKAAEPNQSPRVLARRSPIYKLDTIESTNNSSGEIVFSDNTLVSISADTEMRIDDYKYGKDVKPSDAKYVATLVKGGFRTITGLIPKQNAKDYQVNTPVATIGVRGSCYAAAIKKGKVYAAYLCGEPYLLRGGVITDLTADHPYYSIDQNGNITQLKEMPAVLRDQAPISTTTFQDAVANNLPPAPGDISGGGPGGSGSPTSGGNAGGIGGTMNGTAGFNGPTNGGMGGGGTVNSFCIQ